MMSTDNTRSTCEHAWGFDALDNCRSCGKPLTDAQRDLRRWLDDVRQSTSLTDHIHNTVLSERLFEER
jgi:hypothetical protein